ncbi:hypothetical protein [Flexithrix dorotheae]|uniref:hypothetical protein n=1 Tax=Flexithrix dorotheae TaxID=70993 RepID=UPI00037B7BF0|nr:hypothetical protein [Flexithrix dorotheae]
MNKNQVLWQTMNLKRINKYLSIYQLIGFTISFILISDFSLRDSPMGIFNVLLMIPAFLPFLIVSTFCLFKREKYAQLIKYNINISSGVLVLSSISLPFFYVDKPD